MMRVSRPACPPRIGRADSGQAMIETILFTWTLIMLLAIIMQVFLIDQHAYRLATRAHAMLLRQAYESNKPSVKYETRWTQKLDGQDQFVPVMPYFSLYGLTEPFLRIQTTTGKPDGYKRIKLGRGTQASVVDGLAGLADPSAYLSQISNGFQQLDDAKQRAQEGQSRTSTTRGRK
jgi:hypothetical protein